MHLDISFPSIQTLIICDNLLESPFNINVQFEHLSIIDFSGNPIKTLKNENFISQKLCSLIIRGSLLTTLNSACLQFIQSIRFLDLSSNGFLTVSKDALANLPNLTSVVAAGSCRNGLELVFKPRSQLLSFDCRNCKISSI